MSLMELSVVEIALWIYRLGMYAKENENFVTRQEFLWHIPIIGLKSWK